MIKKSTCLGRYMIIKGHECQNSTMIYIIFVYTCISDRHNTPPSAEELFTLLLLIISLLRLN